MSEKTPYIVTVAYADMRARRRIKAPKAVKFTLKGVVGIAVVADEKPRVILPLREISDEDFKELAEKYGINLDLINATIVEIKEERKGERELKFGE